MSIISRAAITRAVLTTADNRLEECIQAARLAVSSIRHSSIVLDNDVIRSLAGGIEAALISAQTLNTELHQEISQFCAEHAYAQEVEFRHMRDSLDGHDPEKVIKFVTRRRALKRSDD